MLRTEKADCIVVAGRCDSAHSEFFADLATYTILLLTATTRTQPLEEAGQIPSRNMATKVAGAIGKRGRLGNELDGFKDALRFAVVFDNTAEGFALILCFRVNQNKTWCPVYGHFHTRDLPHRNAQPPMPVAKPCRGH